MIDDLVARLHARKVKEVCECFLGPHLQDGDDPDEECQEAADTITALCAEVERLTAALEPFANALKGNWSHQPDHMPLDVGHGPDDLRLRLTLGDFRRAAALQETDR
jgi:hypothetical protein